MNRRGFLRKAGLAVGVASVMPVAALGAVGAQRKFDKEAFLGACKELREYHEAELVKYQIMAAFDAIVRRSSSYSQAKSSLREMRDGLSKQEAQAYWRLFGDPKRRDQCK